LPTVLIYSEGQGKADELVPLLSKQKRWEVFTQGAGDSSGQVLPAALAPVDFHFLIYTKKLDKLAMEEIGKIRQRLPFTDFIYYHSFLFNKQYMILAKFKMNACIIGSYRQRYLMELLPGLWEKHWKRIPPNILSCKGKSTSTLANQLITYIENHTLDHCNINDLAAFSGLSHGQLRSKFKNLFNINFRDFKQQLFTHYETRLLVEKKFKPNDVYQLLNYATLANFSRSFRSRHGESWRDFNVGDTDISH